MKNIMFLLSQNNLFFGSIHIGENVYFVDPVSPDYGSDEKQRFSKLNDPMDLNPFLDPTLGMSQSLETLLGFYRNKELFSLSK